MNWDETHLIKDCLQVWQNMVIQLNMKCEDTHSTKYLLIFPRELLSGSAPENFYMLNSARYSCIFLREKSNDINLWYWRFYNKIQHYLSISLFYFQWVRQKPEFLAFFCISGIFYREKTINLNEITRKFHTKNVKEKLSGSLFYFCKIF